MKRKPAKKKARVNLRGFEEFERVVKQNFAPVGYSITVDGCTQTVRVPIDSKRYVQFVGTITKAKRGEIVSPIFRTRSADTLEGLQRQRLKIRRYK